MFQQKYTDDELIGMAKNYSDYPTLHKRNRALYETIHRRHLEEQAYSHFTSWGRKTWTIEQARQAAEECDMDLHRFCKMYRGAYWACWNNGWLDILFPNRRKNKKEWTFQDFKTTLSKAKSLKDWRKKYKVLAQVAVKKKWFILEDERITEEARSHGIEVFKSQYAKNILSNFTIMTKENIKCKALLFVDRTNFKDTLPKHFQRAYRLKILDEVCSHMPQPKSRNFRLIYAAEFPDNYVYVGLTYDLDVRIRRHLNDTRSSVYKHIKISSLQPNFIIVHNYEPKDVASILEGQYKDKYEKEGWIMLNRAKTGGLGAINYKYSEKI